MSDLGISLARAQKQTTLLAHGIRLCPGVAEMLFQLVRQSLFLQNLAANMIGSIHPSIDHNVDKLKLIKKALFHCELEAIPGDYFEFGVFEGTSLYFASRTHRQLRSKEARQFYGFDSFEDGFKYFNSDDIHPFFKEGDFKSSYEKVKARLRKFPNATLVKGYFENTVAGKSVDAVCQSDKCAIVFIDCDLMGPAKIALDFVRPVLQVGSVIILDDYWAYKGSTDKGTAGALKAFTEENPSIRLREYHRYGCGGTSFVVEKL